MKAPDPSSTVGSDDFLESSWLNDPLNYSVKLFIAFLQTMFEEAPVGAFHWRPSPEETEIFITEENPIQVEALEQKPAISVVLGPTRFNGSSLDDLVSVDRTNAKEVHTDLIPGNMTLNCVSRVAQEARFVGWICARTIWNLRKMFVRESHMHEVGRNIQIGSVTPAGALVSGDTEAEWHAVPVTCPFFLQWTDTTLPLTHDWNGRPIHKLNSFTLRLQARMGERNLTHTQEAGPMLWGGQAANTRASMTSAKLQGRAQPRGPRLRGRVLSTSRRIT
jgi:hypothetical protein